MAALQEILDEQARIKAELQRMENDDTVTEEDDGDLRDTLLARKEELDKKAAPIVERMEKIRSITRAAGDESNLERPDGATGGIVTAGNGRRAGPDLVTSRYANPYEDLEAVRSGMVRTPELRGRAFDAIEGEAKRGNMAHDAAETATQLMQRNLGREGRGIAEHILTTGSQEYQDAFNAYLARPQENAQRTALSLTNVNGGYLLPFVLDQLQVA